MSNDREMLKKLLKIAEKQQKIINKLAQQLMDNSENVATAEDFNAILLGIIGPLRPTKVVEARYLPSIHSYELKIQGSLSAEESSKFLEKAAAKWTGGDKTKLRVVRMMDLPVK